MNQDPYPTDPCPFCAIGTAFPFRPQQEGLLWRSSRKSEELSKCVPDEDEAGDFERCRPSAFVVLRSQGVVAFLDILPMVGGMCFFFCCLLLMGWEEDEWVGNGWLRIR
jgi:hypothetical protein